MINWFLNKVSIFGVFILLLSCSARKGSNSVGIKALKFLGEFTMPHRMQFEGTTVGGLSGIDYNPAEDLYYLICDDRSDINPARYYTARIAVNKTGIDTVQLLKVTTLLQPNKKPYPNKGQDSLNVPDPEAIRYNPVNNTLTWSSEGERIVRKEKVILTNPSITTMNKEGQFIDSFPVPPNIYMTVNQKGPRQNGVFEGLTFTPDYKALYVSMEEPLYEDGPRAGINDTSGWIRIIRYDVATKRPVAQYAYRIDPVVQEPISPGLFVVNGVTDILAVNDHQLLVTERSFSTGRLTCNVRVYLAELAGAENIADVPSLQQQPVKRPIRKTRLLNMDNLGRWVDNVEGATWGPRLPNGQRSLLFVTDDNFSKQERIQFFLFAVQ